MKKLTYKIMYYCDSNKEDAYTDDIEQWFEENEIDADEPGNSGVDRIEIVDEDTDEVYNTYYTEEDGFSYDSYLNVDELAQLSYLINDEEIDEDMFWKFLEICTRASLEDKTDENTFESYMMDNKHDLDSGRTVTYGRLTFKIS